MGGRQITVLISSAGRRVALLEAFREDAAQLGLEARIVATDRAPEFSSACQVADVAVQVPIVQDDAFIPAMLAIAERERVHLIIPTIDTELSKLADARDSFADLGARVVVSAPDVVALAGDKYRTATFLQQADIPAPHTFLPGEVTTEAPAFPRVIKPRRGSGSVGIRVAADPSEFASLVPGAEDIVQEWIDGSEYTINFYVTAEGELGAIVPHLRIETRSGEVSKGRTERHEVFRDIAQRIVAKLPGMAGPHCFQARWPDGGPPKVLEINARFCGGYPLARAAGAPFSRWLLEEAAGLQPSVADDWRDGTIMLRYDAAVFL